MLKLNIVYHSDTTVNYSEFGQFTIVMSIVPYSRTMLNYGNFCQLLYNLTEKKLYEPMLF